MLVLPQPDGTVLFDREGLSVLLKRPKETIRKRCPVAEYHTDGRALYDAVVCEEILREVRVRSDPTG